MNNDKQTEYQRYAARAQALLAAGTSSGNTSVFGAMAIPPIFRAPYLYYEYCIRRFVFQNHDVLELGAGTGLHTYALAQTGARVVGSDISSHSLEVLSQRIGGVSRIGKGTKTGIGGSFVNQYRAQIFAKPSLKRQDSPS